MGRAGDLEYVIATNAVWLSEKRAGFVLCIFAGPRLFIVA